MLPNQIAEKLNLFNNCPFFVCASNNEGEVVFINSFGKNMISQNSNENLENVFDQVHQLFDVNEVNIQEIKVLILKALQNNSPLKHSFKVINKVNNVLNVALSVEPFENQYFLFFFKYFPFKNHDLSQFVSDSIVHNANDTIISYTLDGEIITWNLEAEKMFGYKKSEVYNKNIFELNFPFPIIEEGDVILEVAKIRGKAEGLILNKEYILNGEKKYFKVTSQAISNNFKEILGISKTFTDITKFVSESKLVEKHVDNLKYLNDIWEAISKDLEVEHILQIVTDVTTKFLDAAYGAFFYNSLSSEGEAMRLFTLSGAKREDFTKLGMPRNTAIFQKTFHSKEVFLLDDVTKYADYGKNAPHKGIPEGHLAVRSYMSVPVISVSGENLGSLLFGHPDAAKFSQQSVEMIQSIARQAAIALDNSRLLESVRTLSSKKDVFIAMAGHELRSPLTIIKGFLQILEEINMDDDLDIYIAKVLEQVDKLNLLIEDLLDIGQIESGEIKIYKAEFVLEDLINETIETVNYAQNTHKVIFKSNSSNIIFADRRRLQQVIYNLIYNGIKYSPSENIVEIEARIENNEAIVKVKDYGIGISESHIPNIFDRFYRVSDNQNISGFGIGLYLCAKIIKRHNGTIFVNSVLNHGSEFIFKIPKNG